MGSESPLADSPDVQHPSSTPSSQKQAQSAETATFQWLPSDSAFLQPTALHIPKVARAWDRQPSSPFSRQRLRVGKVWKRPGANAHRHVLAQAAATRSTDPISQAEIRALKRVRTRVSLGASARQSSPQKPVKKMCLDAGFGLGAKISLWDGSETPARKIVTRSSADQSEMLALSEDENDVIEGVGLMDEEEGDVTIEIVHEDGTTEEVDIEEIGDAEWEDENDGRDADSSAEEEDNTSVGDGPSQLDDDFPDVTFAQETVTIEAQGDDPEETPTAPESITDAEQSTVEQSHASDAFDVEQDGVITPNIPADIQQAGSRIKPERDEVILPDGFLSPVKRRPRVKRAARQSMNSRRRTLPVQFAPVYPVVVASEPDAMRQTVPEGKEETEEVQDTAPPADEADNIQEQIEKSVDIESADHEAATEDDEWEDIEEPAQIIEEIDVNADQEYSVEDTDDSALTSDGTEDVDMQDSPTLEPEPQPPGLESHQTAASPRKLPLLSPAGVPSSPIPTFEGPHPRLPLRRSPRRQSTSPLKRSVIWPLKETSHLVAFSPVKMADPFSLNEDPVTKVQKSPVFIETPLSPSEPTTFDEEPPASPVKNSKPRLSDDTALLQAFLSRAAESKSERRVSTAGMESISNRRDSDSVRQALASPVRSEVLGDLDPNSPSPRKASISADPYLDADESIAPSTVDETNEDVNDITDDYTLPRTRRSGRQSRRANPSNPSTPAPNKISIRGNADNVVLKRSEAQEVALLTRTNTRRNKGGAVLPPIRLGKLNFNAPSQSDESTLDVSLVKAAAAEGKKSVTWAETLVEFYQGGDVAECSILSGDAEPAQQQGDGQPASAATPSETPSKPKVRRLKPAKPTASTPAKPAGGRVQAAVAVASDPVVEQLPPVATEPAPRAKTSTRRRSRIATPAKGLSRGSLLPAEIAAMSAGTEPQPSAAPVMKRKAPVSKLPAPASSTVSQGKENLIASPPKKKPILAATKGFAPKFDFSAPKMKLDMSSSSFAALGGGDTGVVPGLMSPAKKAGRRAVFANSTCAAEDGSGVGRREEMPGLSSPAKKRTRRVDL